MVSADALKILPELIVAAGGLLLLVAWFLKSSRVLGWITLGILLIALDLKLFGLVNQPMQQVIFSGLLVQDRFASFFQILILIAMLLVVLGIMAFAREEMKSRRELYALLLLSTVGLLLVVGAQHLLLLYLGLELISILSYLLAGLSKKEMLAIEGALKYFLFGTLATAKERKQRVIIIANPGRVLESPAKADRSSLPERFPMAMTAVKAPTFMNR